MQKNHLDSFRQLAQEIEKTVNNELNENLKQLIEAVEKINKKYDLPGISIRKKFSDADINLEEYGREIQNSNFLDADSN